MGTAMSRSTAAAQAQAKPQKPPQPKPVAGSVAAGIIDLTAEGDDSDDSDEPLGGAASVSAPMGSSSQDVESDEDEEWPDQAPAQEVTVVAESGSVQQPQASNRPITGDGDRGVNSDQDDDEEEDEELPIRVAPSREISSESVRTAKLSDSEENEPMENGHGELQSTADDQPPADDQLSAPAKPQAAAVVGGHLEDGEIFEEGAVSASPEKVKETIAQELQAARDAAAGGDASRPKKHKKRGKKKAKRKLDAMMIQQAGPEFDRAVRHQPFMLRNPHDPRMVFLGPGAMFGDPAAHPPPPPPLPNNNGDGLPFTRPMFAHDQIMRVNRHGSVKMFNSQMDFQSGDVPTTTLGPGGFNYVMVPRPPPRIDPKQAILGPPPSGIPKPPSSVSAESVNSQDEGEPMMNLDDLRAAALRTKKTEKTPGQTAAESTMVSNPDAASSISVSQANSPPQQEEEPNIDELRAAILKSMKSRPRKSSAVATKTVVDKVSERDSASPNRDTTTQANDVPDTMIVKSAEAARTTELPQVSLPSSDSLVSSTSGSGSGSVSESASSEAGSSKAGSPAAGATPAPTVSIGTMTPEFRPLTAASQSIVIRLCPEDYVTTTPTTVPPPRRPVAKTHGSNIEAAIEEMKRKIAEREKQLQSNNNRTAPASKPRSSAAVSPGKLTKSVPESDPTEEDFIDQDGGDDEDSNVQGSSSGSVAADGFILNEENSIPNAPQEASAAPESTAVIAKQVVHKANVEPLDVPSQPTDAETIVVD